MTSSTGTDLWQQRAGGQGRRGTINDTSDDWTKYANSANAILDAAAEEAAIVEIL